MPLSPGDPQVIRWPRRSGGIGRRASLRGWCPQGRGGSSPPSDTNREAAATTSPGGAGRVSVGPFVGGVRREKPGRTSRGLAGSSVGLCECTFSIHTHPKAGSGRQISWKTAPLWRSRSVEVVCRRKDRTGGADRVSGTYSRPAAARQPWSSRQSSSSEPFSAGAENHRAGQQVPMVDDRPADRPARWERAEASGAAPCLGIDFVAAVGAGAHDPRHSLLLSVGQPGQPGHPYAVQTLLWVTLNGSFWPLTATVGVRSVTQRGEPGRSDWGGRGPRRLGAPRPTDENQLLVPGEVCRTPTHRCCFRSPIRAPERPCRTSK